MTPTEIHVYGFVAIVGLLAVVTWLHSKSIDPPLENEAYLAEHPELLELKTEVEEGDE